MPIKYWTTPVEKEYPAECTRMNGRTIAIDMDLGDREISIEIWCPYGELPPLDISIEDPQIETIVGWTDM